MNKNTDKFSVRFREETEFLERADRTGDPFFRSPELRPPRGEEFLSAYDTMMADVRRHLHGVRPCYDELFGGEDGFAQYSLAEDGRGRLEALVSTDKVIYGIQDGEGWWDDSTDLGEVLRSWDGYHRTTLRVLALLRSVTPSGLLDRTDARIDDYGFVHAFGETCHTPVTLALRLVKGTSL